MEKDFIKSLLYMAVGYASMNKEKVEEFTKNISEKGKMTEEEGKKVIEDVIQRAKEIKEDIMVKIEDVSQQLYETLNLATKKEIEELKARIDALESGRGNTNGHASSGKATNAGDDSKKGK
jgi:polyhydroxyalkanoate synthesis regulator phasin